VFSTYNTYVKYLKTICFTAFFLSGLASIVYELTWIRLLRNVFGSDSLAFSSLLTIFIGGIASGTYISGKIIKKYFSSPNGASEELVFAIDKTKNFFFILIYGLIELIVGIYALITPILLSDNTIGNIWVYLNQALGENIVLISLIKFLISGLVLIIPTLLLGLSYPILVELVTSNESKSSSKYKLGSSNLYATNTLGSIFGSIIGGFILIPNFGLKTSILIATLINFFIALIVYLLKRSNQDIFKNFKIKDALVFIVKNAQDVKDKAIKEVSKGHQFWILVVIGVILGFSNLGLEVIWNKIFALIIGSSIFSATIVISVVLAGISFGAYSLNYFTEKIKDEDLDSFLSLNIVLFAFAIFLSTVFLNSCPWFFIKINHICTDLFRDQSWFFANLTKYITVSLIIFPVTFLEGLAYAIVLYKASEISKAKNDPVGSRIAIISYWNTIGAIAGSFSAGFILIPFFSQFGSGISNSIRFILIIAFLTAATSLFINEKINRKLCLILISVATIVCSLLLPTLAKNTLNSGTEIYKATKFKDISKKNFDKEHEKILFYKEGLNSIVTVVEDEAANALFLKNNGKIEAGIALKEDYPSKADTVTQNLLGILPIILKPDSKSALVVGMGSGKTVESLAIAGKENKLKEITVCEIEKEVFKASEKFFVRNFPVKVIKKNVDARNYLNTTEKDFDIILSQPSDPWISGTLFTKEFWYKARARLKEGGIFFQWLQLYALDKEHLGIALRTFQEAFPESYVFRPPHSAELILVGSESLSYFDIKSIEATIHGKHVREKLLGLGISDTADLLANLTLTPKDFNNIKESDKKPQYQYSTDDNMSLELHTSKNIDSFHESIKINSEYLSSLAESENLYKFFDSLDETNFLTKLSISHNKHSRYNHKLLAKILATRLHEEKTSPLSYLAIYEIYKANNELEKADSVIYEASKVYADTVSRINNQTVIFKDLHSDFHLDFDQNLALYKIFLRAQNFTSAQKVELLLKKQLLEKKRDSRDIYKAEIFYEKAMADLYNLDSKPDFTTITKISENLKRANRFDPYNHVYIKEQAKLSLLRAQLTGDKSFTELALDNLKEVNSIYPLDPEVHEKIAEIYYTRLPKSRVKFMSKSTDGEFETNLKLTLEYLKNTLELNAYSYKANLFMADIQYKLGNLDLSYKHIKRLEKLCADQSRCLAELGNENKELLEELNEKVSKLVKN
jgi:spermidine synthase